MAQGDIRHKSILWGCDNWARVVDETTPYISKSAKGIEMISYLIIPNDDLKDAYPYELKKPGVLNKETQWGKARWVEYPTKWVTDKNPSRRNAIVRVDCTFDGRETALTKKHIHLTEDLDYYQKANERLNLASIADAETIEMIMKEKRVMAEQLNELVEKMPGGKKNATTDDKEEVK